MRIPGLDVKRKKAVVILGAGASRGAHCFRDTLLPPPLDTDFFSLLERVQHRERALKQLLEFVKGEFGEAAFPRMEELFTQIEALSEFHENLNITPGPRVTRYRRQLDTFVGNIARFFRHVFIDGASGKHRTCDHHDRLSEFLHAEDAIVTFNYACLMDEALRRKAGRGWDPTRSYGFEIQEAAAAAWRAEASRGRPIKVPIALPKLHGSLNWDRSAGFEPTDLLLRKDPYTHNGRAAAEVVPPVWDKTIKEDQVLKHIWKEARRTLPTGPVLIVIGYSVPATDLLSQALMRVAAFERAENQKLSHVIVVNPDVDARRRLIRLIQGGMDLGTSVIEMNTLPELSRLLH
jgi:hypothetical protein